MYRVIRLHPAAPTKPSPGEACNGCGVCCASEPCPLGVLVSGRRHGSCAALEWSTDSGVYRCGLIERPAAYLWPRLQRWAPLLRRVAARGVAAGVGCDCDLDVVNPQGY